MPGRLVIRLFMPRRGHARDCSLIPSSVPLLYTATENFGSDFLFELTKKGHKSLFLNFVGMLSFQISEVVCMFGCKCKRFNVCSFSNQKKWQGTHYAHIKNQWIMWMFKSQMINFFVTFWNEHKLFVVNNLLKRIFQELRLKFLQIERYHNFDLKVNIISIVCMDNILISDLFCFATPPPPP